MGKDSAQGICPVIRFNTPVSGRSHPPVVFIGGHDADPAPVAPVDYLYGEIEPPAQVMGKRILECAGSGIISLAGINDQRFC